MFQVGQLAVYPAHGVGGIESVQEREVSGNRQNFTSCGCWTPT